jgi:hypothetical protein
VLGKIIAKMPRAEQEGRREGDRVLQHCSTAAAFRVPFCAIEQSASSLVPEMIASMDPSDTNRLSIADYPDDRWCPARWHTHGKTTCARCGRDLAAGTVHETRRARISYVIPSWPGGSIDVCQHQDCPSEPPTFPNWQGPLTFG